MRGQLAPHRDLRCAPCSDRCAGLRSAGAGKSSLVNELQKALLPRGWFASGKFDQYQRDVPYAPLAPAFQRLVGIILADVEAELGRWRDTTVTAVDPSERVINPISHLERVIGQPPPPTELAPKDAQRCSSRWSDGSPLYSRARLTGDEQIAAARAAQAGGLARIPIGRIVAGTEINTGWNWHL